MHILIDAHMLGEKEGGNETYIAGLLDGFETAPLPDRVQITALHTSKYKPRPRPASPVRFAELADTDNFRRLFWKIPAKCRDLDADILHVTYNASPFLACSVVVTVHDITFRRYPTYFSPRVRLLMATLLLITMHRARLILTLSEASKQDITHYYPFTRDKIVAIPLAAGSVSETRPDIEAVKKYAGQRDFILTVGTVQPRKNISRLIQSYIFLRQNEVTDACLIIVGRADWQHSSIQEIASASAYSQDIIFTGYLSEAMVAALYRTCTVFVYPSLYEGFGLPVLEAMACGAPVITSNLSSLPEIAGDAAILVDPHSVEQISQAIEGVLKNRDLREDLRRQSLKQAACFSWKRTATETLEAYQWALQTGASL